MTELIGHRPNAAEAGDDIAYAHADDVRYKRTYVNVESVRVAAALGAMTEPTVGERLISLKERSGLSLDEIARRSGYAGRTSVAQFFKEHYSPTRLGSGVAEKLSAALVGEGEPPIERSEIFELVGAPVPSEVVPVEPGKMPTLRGSRRDIPVYGTATGGDLLFDADGSGEVFVELTFLEATSAIQWVRRPHAMDGMRDVYALYVVGSSMIPRFGPGHPLFVDPVRPASIGDDVVVQLLDDQGDVTCALVKTLIGVSSKEVRLHQYNPQLSFRVPIERVGRMHRIISPQEIWFGR